MNKKDFMREIIRALNKLNAKIDKKIMLGLSYKSESKQHAHLRQLIALNR